VTTDDPLMLKYYFIVFEYDLSDVSSLYTSPYYMIPAFICLRLPSNNFPKYNINIFIVVTVVEQLE